MQPNEAAALGLTADIPMMIGSNAADAQLFVSCSNKPIPLPADAPTSPPSPPSPLNSLVFRYDAGLFVAFGTHSLDIARLYPVHQEAAVSDGLNAIMTDFLFHCPSQRWANHSASRSPQ
jgi:carboxylesterase type B